MDVNNMNEGWEKQSPLLNAAGKRNPFNVPDGYFAEMQQQITSRITVESAIPGDENRGFSVPEGYFATLEDQIISSVKTEEIRSRADNEGFTVPHDYFESLQESILQKTGITSKPAEAKVRRLAASWLSYAAAACIMIATGTGLYFYQKSESIDAKLAYIPDEAIVDYLLINSDAGDMPVIIDNLNNTEDIEPAIELSDQEIEQYLETTL